MSTSILSPEELDVLRRYNTPTISNAIELFDVRPRNVGFLPHRIRCLLPDLGAVIGYAVTSRTRASMPELDEAPSDLLGEYLSFFAHVYKNIREGCTRVGCSGHGGGKAA